MHPESLLVRLAALCLSSALLLSACNQELICEPEACDRLCHSDADGGEYGECKEDGSCVCHLKQNTDPPQEQDTCAKDADCVAICGLNEATEGLRCTDAGACICPEAACAFDVDCENYCTNKTGSAENARCTDAGACKCN